MVSMTGFGETASGSRLRVPGGSRSYLNRSHRLRFPQLLYGERIMKTEVSLKAANIAPRASDGLPGE
jgi:hypothetical protein